MYRVDIKEIMSRVSESHQNIENNMWDVAIEVGGQLAKNNKRSNRQEEVLESLEGGNYWIKNGIGGK